MSFIAIDRTDIPFSGTATAIEATLIAMQIRSAVPATLGNHTARIVIGSERK
jgi:hypothetical protein